MKAEDILPEQINECERDGVSIRKGTVGAFLVNAKLWSDPRTAPADRAVAERDLIEALPALKALGLFDVLCIRNERLQRLIEIHSGSATVRANRHTDVVCVPYFDMFKR
jgi:hypothetical protein